MKILHIGQSLFPHKMVSELDPNVRKKTHHSSNGCHKHGMPPGEIAVYKGIGEIFFHAIQAPDLSHHKQSKLDMRMALE